MDNINWTDDEVKILKENYGKIETRKLIPLLPLRTPDGIHTKANRLGLTSNFKGTSVRTWSNEEEEILRKHFGKEPLISWAPLIPKKSLDAIQCKATAMGLKSSLRGYNVRNFRYMDQRLFPEDEDIEKIWKNLEDFQEQCKTLSTHQDEITVRMDNTPILIAFLADLHIGAVSGKYKELRERIDLLSSLPNVYVISCGDTVDNYLPDFHSPGQFGEIVPPEIQKQLVEYIFKKINGKMLALVQGCHDEASHNTDDFDWTKYLSLRLDCANLGFGGFVNVVLGSQTYRICVRHKFRFGSQLNLTHTVKRMREQLGDFDIGVVAHNHQAAIEELAMPDKHRVFVRPGSFKGADRYARQLGFTDTGAQVPSIILFPNERKILPFMNLDDAVKVLQSFI
jgi:hypothetical protein